MKYESAILKRLIDIYGVVGNPRYISEIIKEFIVRGKECYPNLFTYQADWLAHIDEFGLNPSYTVSYTGQSIYAPNTLERPVKSAILTGQTLVNDIGDIRNTNDKPYIKEFYFKKIKINTNYLISYNTVSNDESVTELAVGFLNDKGQWSKNIENAPISGKFILNSGTNPHYFRLNNKTTNSTLTVNNIMVIEYQEGMENWDIPYFEGMQSVQMPVLTTSNEDGTKSNILSTSEDVELRGIEDVQDTLDCLTGKLTQRIGEVVLDGSEEWVLQTNPTDVRGAIYRISITDIDTTISNTLINCICDKAMVGSWNTIYNTLKNKTFAVLQNQQLRIQFDGTLEELKIWLAETQPTIQYFKQMSIKTVDLTILDQNGQNVKQIMSFNGGTHFNTKSSEGSPLPTVVVSVESDLEETLKRCSLEGNTL